MRGISVVDVALGATGLVVRGARDAGRRVQPVVQPVVEPLVRRALRPPLVPPTWQPRHWLATLADDGRRRRSDLTRTASGRLDDLVPQVTDEVLRRLSPTDLVQRFVDLDEVVASVDVDAVVARADLDAAARRLDLDGVLDRMDLTTLVLQRVDLDLVVKAVLEKLDLIALAQEVIDGVDLPEIIRESTGSMAADTVRGVRMQGIVADEAVGNAVDRFLRRHGRHTEAPVLPTSTPEPWQPPSSQAPPPPQPQPVSSSSSSPEPQPPAEEPILLPSQREPER